MAGRLSTFRPEDNVKNVRDSLNTDKRLSVHMIADTRESITWLCTKSIGEDLGTRKICEKNHLIGNIGQPFPVRR